MESGLGGLFAGFGLGLVILCIALVIAWIVLPFAIIGTKPILRELLAETKRTNELLRELKRTAEPPAKAAELPPSLRTGPLFGNDATPVAPAAIGAGLPLRP